MAARKKAGRKKAAKKKVARKKAGRKKAGRKKAGRKKAASRRAAAPMIISKARVKATVTQCNVGSEFYGALENHVRQVIKDAQARALANGRKTLRTQDI